MKCLPQIVITTPNTETIDTPHSGTLDPQETLYFLKLEPVLHWLLPFGRIVLFLLPKLCSMSCFACLDCALPSAQSYALCCPSVGPCCSLAVKCLWHEYFGCFVLGPLGICLGPGICLLATQSCKASLIKNCSEIMCWAFYYDLRNIYSSNLNKKPTP